MYMMTGLSGLLNGEYCYTVDQNIDDLYILNHSKRRNVLYITNSAAILTNWNHRQLIRLFILAAALFLLTVLASLSAEVLIASRVISHPIMIPTALIILLGGWHVHLYMVRSGVVPQLFGRPEHTEFLSLTDDIANHAEFRKLKEYHHHTTPIYDHAVQVAYFSYVLAKVFRMDYHAAARGGLLHDFFLYDWRERKAQDEKRSSHGKEHPHIALKNAQTYFAVTDREADIIVKHMFPKTRKLPRYRESFIVSLMDKVSTLVEYTCHALRCQLRQRDSSFY